MLKADLTRHIRESNLIEEIDSLREDRQSALAWAYLSEQPVLTHYDICKVQKMITVNQTDLLPNERGYYRKTTVFIGDSVGSSSGLIPDLMNNWLLDMEHYKEFTPKEMHIRFEKIHPFADGNGRTGRMLMWWHELKLGEDPTLIRAFTKQQEYYNWFQ